VVTDRFEPLSRMLTRWVDSTMSADDTPDEGAERDPSSEDVDVDEEEEESFPASDPPSSWSGQGADLDE
jgi:hypothetical protein